MRVTRVFFFYLTIVLGISALFVTYTAYSQWHVYRRSVDGMEAVDAFRRVLHAQEMLSKERGPSNQVLGALHPGDPVRVAKLAAVRRATDDALQAAAERLAHFSYAGDGAALVTSVRDGLDGARRQIDALGALPLAQREAERISEVVARMVALVSQLSPAANRVERAATSADPVLAGHATTARIASEMREVAGQLGSLFAAPVTTGRNLSEADNYAVESLRGRLAGLLGLLQGAADNTDDSRLGAAVVEMRRSYFGDGSALVDGLLAAGRSDARYPMNMVEFTDRYVPAMQTILAVRDVALDVMVDRAADDRDTAQAALVAMAGGLALLSVILIGAGLLLRRRIVNPMVRIAAAIHQVSDGVLGVEVPEAKRPDEIGEIARAVLRLADVKAAMVRHQAELAQQEAMDRLTGLLNRRHFDQRAGEEWKRARRFNKSVAMLMLDIDHLKAVNDRWGRATGDLVLKAVAAACLGSVREMDVIGRVGGEEFAILLPEADQTGAVEAAERLREVIAGLTLASSDGRDIAVSVSIGVAVMMPGTKEVAAIIGRAEAALYEAKHMGRNCVRVWAPTDPSQFENDGRTYLRPLFCSEH